MTSKTVALLLTDLGVTKSLSRPQVSNDNPYSESQFKTMKYHSTFPEKFGSIQDARQFCQGFFDWYNNDHYHSSVALMTPKTIHYGEAQACSEGRQRVLGLAHKEHPGRFPKGAPKVIPLPNAAWINRPKSTDAANAFVAATGDGTILGGVR